MSAISVWGVDAAATKLNGMFAFALWDLKNRVLHLVRDRAGEKPLYYGWQDGSFLFGSELKALRAFPGFKRTIDPDALSLFFRHGYIPTPYSIYCGIQKVPFGSILSLSFQDPFTAHFRKYWDLSEVATSPMAGSFRGSFEDASAQLESLLEDATKIRMAADVPLGAFLSGGIDSSTIVAMMQKVSTNRVQTFTIGFNDSAFNEAEHARVVAQHLGTEHTELYIDNDQALDLVPELPQLWDEPFSDPSQVPTALLARLARKSVTVALSGDAGDELFAGYGRYLSNIREWNTLSRVPLRVRKTLGLLRPAVGKASTTIAMLQTAFPSLAGSWGVDALNTLSRVQNFFHRVAVDDERVFYRQAFSHFPNASAIVVGGQDRDVSPDTANTWAKISSPFDRRMYVDSIGYLPDDLLVKVDRATMGIGLEARVPLLDHRIIEFAWSLPEHYKTVHNATKRVLRSVLYRHVPKPLVDRPKMGFSMPIDHWLRGPLRDWALSLLSEGALSHGLLNKSFVAKEWSMFAAGQPSGFRVWDILMFQAWYQSQV